MSVRSVHFYPAWDKRSDDPKKDYGVSGVNIHMRLVDDDWAAELVMLTPWMLPAVQQWHKSLEPTIGAKVTPTCDVAVHHRNGTSDEFGRIVQPGQCDVFPDTSCQNVPVSAFLGERLYKILVVEGEEPVWEGLANIISNTRSE